MNQFFENLRKEAEANPILAIGAVAGLIAALAKYVESSGHARGSRAYARDVDRRVRQSR